MVEIPVRGRWLAILIMLYLVTDLEKAIDLQRGQRSTGRMIRNLMD